MRAFGGLGVEQEGYTIERGGLDSEPFGERGVQLEVHKGRGGDGLVGGRVGRHESEHGGPSDFEGEGEQQDVSEEEHLQQSDPLY